MEKFHYAQEEWISSKTLKIVSVSIYFTLSLPVLVMTSSIFNFLNFDCVAETKKIL